MHLEPKMVRFYFIWKLAFLRKYSPFTVFVHAKEPNDTVHSMHSKGKKTDNASINKKWYSLSFLSFFSLFHFFSHSFCFNCTVKMYSWKFPYCTVATKGDIFRVTVRRVTMYVKNEAERNRSSKCRAGYKRKWQFPGFSVYQQEVETLKYDLTNADRKIYSKCAAHGKFAMVCREKRG
jgi:hypothetical protein